MDDFFFLNKCTEIIKKKAQWCVLVLKSRLLNFYSADGLTKLPRIPEYNEKSLTNTWQNCIIVRLMW